uniref:Uncharacterized protein n=1 Tax=Rhizophora mucronata TaxID=61149 RepID=A0A2P2Q0C5_RHIMU
MEQSILCTFVSIRFGF